jgi:hypothetical protein
MLRSKGVYTTSDILKITDICKFVLSGINLDFSIWSFALEGIETVRKWYENSVVLFVDNQPSDDSVESRSM